MVALHGCRLGLVALRQPDEPLLSDHAWLTFGKPLLSGDALLEKLGTHCILELYDCPRHTLEDPESVAKILEEASRRGLSTLLNKVIHRFHPQGVTALGVLAESHISIHTWPEHDYAAADVFTCGTTARPVEACQYLVEALGARSHNLLKIARGNGAPKLEFGLVDRTGDDSQTPVGAGEPGSCLEQSIAPASG